MILVYFLAYKINTLFYLGSSPTSKNNKDQNCSDSEESSHSKHTEPTPTASSKEQTSERKSTINQIFFINKCLASIQLTNFL